MLMPMTMEEELTTGIEKTPSSGINASLKQMVKNYNIK